MEVILETERLILRQFTIEDAENIYQLNGDPEVVKYTGDRAFRNVAEARSFLQNYDQYKKFGYGRWAVIDKSNAEFLGWCGLKFEIATGENDIGFRFLKKHWNKGYATESAKACIVFGFSKLGMQTIIGRTMKENTASVKVLEKIGMAYEREFDFFQGHSGLIYRILK